jgi:hypothetical protein
VGEDRFQRPEAVILGEDSLIPPENQIRPTPNRFTHQLVKSEPFYFGRKVDSSAPDGELLTGTQVILLRDDGEARCRVVDGRGLHVEVSCAALADLSTLSPEPRPAGH